MIMPTLTIKRARVGLLLIGLASTVCADWLDPDTPASARQTFPLFPDHTGVPTPAPTSAPTPASTNQTNHEHAWDNRYELVFSDEFNLDGRNFHDGFDPKWTALDKNDYTNEAMHYYSPDNIQTKDGDLIIKTEAKDVLFVGNNDTNGSKRMYKKHFKSAMLQSWNKFCFTGGIIEAEVQLPGKHDVSGIWPAFWLLGNLARHTYVGSTNHVWPWSSDICTNKSQTAQRISGCMNSQHFDMKKGFGRGAPEIDIFEVQAGPTPRNNGDFWQSPVGQPYMTSSYQVAPGRMENRPANGWWPGPNQWYNNLEAAHDTCINTLFYGEYNHFRGDGPERDYWSDAISFMHQLRKTHFEKKHKYRLEWGLPNEDEGTDGFIRWFVDGKMIVNLNGTSLVEAGYGEWIKRIVRFHKFLTTQCHCDSCVF